MFGTSKNNKLSFNDKLMDSLVSIAIVRMNKIEAKLAMLADIAGVKWSEVNINGVAHARFVLKNSPSLAAQAENVIHGITPTVKRGRPVGKKSTVKRRKRRAVRVLT